MTGMTGMTRPELVSSLIDALLRESWAAGQRASKEPRDRRFLRGLMNLRPPEPIAPEILALQDALLQSELLEKQIKDASGLPGAGQDGRLALWQGDITTLRADAIVNAANAALLGCFHPCHGCIDNAIHSAAGIQLRLACHAIMEAQGHEEPPGRAKLTPGFNLPARYVLHTVGPIVDGALTGAHRRRLADCYRACMDCAAEQGLESVAFCCISTGVYRFPHEAAAEIAVDTVRACLDAGSPVERVVFNVFTDRDAALYRAILA